MKLDWNQIDRPIIALSPMADMTDSAFCRVVKSIASPVMFREMISSEALVRGSEKTMEMAELHDDERPIVQQIFGANPEVMGEAAAMVEKEFHPEGIDINMGCPVYKLTSNFNGSALMKDVRRVKEAVSIPVMYNGDIFTWQDCFEALKETGCDGVLIARGGLGNPWIFKQIEQVIAGEEPMVVTMEERIRVMKMHLDLHVKQYGEGGVRTFRKHISWYLKGIPNIKEFKVRLMAALTQDEVIEILEEIAEKLD
jgi:tRNA-dihydrouridine synthase